jgi:hypothetical protein
MTAFRTLLALIFVAVVSYTVPVVAQHGLNLFPVFFGGIAKMGWAGQFNVDFTGFLTLSGLWLAWRHHFSPGGLALGVLGFFGGAPVLTAYLFVASLRAKGDVATLLLGQARAQGKA